MIQKMKMALITLQSTSNLKFTVFPHMCIYFFILQCCIQSWHFVVVIVLHHLFIDINHYMIIFLFHLKYLHHTHT